MRVEKVSEDRSSSQLITTEDTGEHRVELKSIAEKAAGSL
jgi:hypothetical protein